MLERLRSRIHKEAPKIVDEVFANGDLTTLDKIRDGEEPFNHPSVQDSYFDRILKIAGYGVVAVTIAGTVYKIAEVSRRRAQEEFAKILVDPLATKTPDTTVNLKKIFQVGQTAIETGLGEQFVTNICSSSVNHPTEALQFWSSLNPFHPIFIELLEPTSEKKMEGVQLPPSHPRHLNPEIHSKYKKMIETMISSFKESPEEASRKIGIKIEKAINGKNSLRTKQ